MTAATAAAALGASVVLVESGRLGGEALHAAVPSKALLAAARHVRAMSGAQAFGVRVARPKIDFMAVQDHLQEVMAGLAPNVSKERLAGQGIRVIDGVARFLDRQTVAVEEAFTIRARHVIIATGSSPALPSIPGLADAPYLTTGTIFDLRVCPRHLLVIGANAVALELAQAFRRLGADVTVIATTQVLAKDDPECVDVVLRGLRRDGVVIRTGMMPLEVRRTRGKVQVVLQNDEMVEGSHLLIAAGRTPNVGDLGLEHARIEYDATGILVDHQMRSSNKQVSAIGDVVGGGPSGQAAACQADVAVRSVLLQQPVKAGASVIPHVVFTDPEFAQVGLTEEEARVRRRRIRVLRWPFRETDRAHAERDTAGHIKVVTDRKGTVLGAAIVGSHASELINVWTLAVANRLNIRAMADVTVPYLTFGEAGRRAALGALTMKLTPPLLRRIVELIRWPSRPA